MDSGFSSNAWTRSKAMSWWSRTSANDSSPERLDRARRYHLESKRGDETRSFLLDFGPTAQSELANLDLFKIDTAAVDALIMSHGHFDHFGGLMPLLERDRGKMHRDLPLYVGGEDTFCYRWFERPNGDRNRSEERRVGKEGRKRRRAW